MKMLIVVLTGFVSAICCHVHLQASEPKVDDMIQVAKAAMKRIDTVQGTFRTYFAALKAPGVIKGPDGQGLFWESQWGFDRVTGREFFDGRQRVDWGEKITYDDIQIAYDGKQLRTWNKTDHGGTIREVKCAFLNFRAPSILWGRNFGEMPTRDLCDLLQNAKLLQLPNVPASITVLQNDFMRGGQACQVTVWLDSEHGFLPKRIELRRKDSQTLSRVVEIDAFHQTRDGVWIPIRGSETMSAVISSEGWPKDMTPEKFRLLSDDEQKAVRSKVKYKTKKLGYGTQTFVLDTADLAVNEPIPDCRFTFEFPKGTFVWNDFEKIGYQVGRDDDPAVRHVETPRRSRKLAVGVLTGILLCLIGVFVWRRIRRRI
jgi:hypothetical protein